MAIISDVGICNVALAELGGARITNLTDGSKNAGLCATFLAFAKELAYANHDWNFAMKRVGNVPARSPAPAWGWTFYYSVPSDCIRVVGIGIGTGLSALEVTGDSDDGDWKVEAAENGEAVIACNIVAPINIRYIYNVSNTQRYSPSFVIYLSKIMKWMLSKPITGKEDIKIQAKQEMDEFLKQAASNDGAEGTPEPYGSTILEDVR